MPNQAKSESSLFAPCLPLENLEFDDHKDPTSLVTFNLKVVKDTKGVAAAVYKKVVCRFDEGTPYKWIKVLEGLEEIWRQNSVDKATDRLATIRTILRGEALSSFEDGLSDSRGANAEDEAVDNEDLEKALAAVSLAIFPFRALEVQQVWMKRHMRKPKGMGTRSWASSLNRINSCLERFPGATPEDKFKESELVELMEWSIPVEWRKQFDKLSYIASLGTKATFIAHCEVQERHEGTTVKKPNGSEKQIPKKAAKSAKKRDGKQATGAYYCTEHGKNPTHSTSDCFTIKNRAVKGNSVSASKPFTGKKFRKEIHSLFIKGQPKKQVLDMFASVIETEKKIIVNKKKRLVQKRLPRRLMITLPARNPTSRSIIPNNLLYVR